MPGTPLNTARENERKLNFWERLYLPEIFKGLAWSASKIWKEPLYTFQYPEEQWYPPDSYRGRPVLVEEDGKARCVSCNLCAKACPPMAISMEAQEIEGPKEREPAWFEIDMLRCIYCGFCEEVCPEEAIVMSKEYDLTFENREEAIFKMDRLLVVKEQLEDRLNYLERQRNPEFGAQWDYDQTNNRHSLRGTDFLAHLSGAREAGELEDGAREAEAREAGAREDGELEHGALEAGS